MVDQENSDKSRSFWTSLPGILTGLTALVTAIGGIFATTRSDEGSVAVAATAEAGEEEDLSEAPLEEEPVEIAGEWITDSGASFIFESAEGEEGSYTAVYDFGDVQGKMTGILEGNVLSGYWVDAGRGECQDQYRESDNWGTFQFDFSDDGTRFTGGHAACDEEGSKESLNGTRSG